jgi:hypothetical protein
MSQQRKQVSLTVFPNEPMARLAEQRLWQVGIPCMIKSLGFSPGLYGSTFNMPHDLLVYEQDQSAARELLGI